MQVLEILGVAMTVAGLAGLAYCIRAGFRMRAEPLPPEAARRRVARLVAVNLGSVALATLGLGLFVAGLILG